MNCERLWDSAETIVKEFRTEIEYNGNNIRQRQSDLGWQYGGKIFESGMKTLKDDLMKTKGYKVLECTAFHFIKPAKIGNPTKRYLLLPIKGPSNLNPGGPISEQFIYIFNNEPILEADEAGVDLICAALEGNGGGSSVGLHVGVESVQ